MPTDTSYLAEFRRRIQDTRPSRRAFSIQVSDPDVTRCIIELTRGHLIIQPQGGSAAAIDLDLTNSRVDTIGALHEVLGRAKGYRVQLDEDASVQHPSIDLASFGPLDCLVTGVQLQHNVFSDSELQDLMTRAIQRHNPQFTTQTIPPQEWAFVLPLAHAEVCKVQAYDASKRREIGRAHV